MKTKIFLIALAMLFFACGIFNKKEEKGVYEYYPYYPDTTANPELHFHWDRTLDSSNISWLGAYGVLENGGGFREVAGEMEIHPDRGDENIYAVADGTVVEVQAVANQGDPVKPNEVEGIWIRYGRNFLLKYVHVGYPQVRAGEIVLRGQKIGKTATFNGIGFWELSVNLRIENETYLDCPLQYFDQNSRFFLLGLWNDPDISHTTVSAQATPWCDGGKISVGNRVNSKFWLDKIKLNH